MTLRVVGAGLGRTGTYSVQLALERLLGAPCYYMLDLFRRPEHVELWNRALDGDPDWEQLLGGYGASVDWTGAAFYRELAAAYPDALVLLSVRDVDSWWRSFDATVRAALDRAPRDDDPLGAVRRLTLRLLEERFTAEWRHERSAREAYVRHNDEVREAIASDRLVEWSPGDGWRPLCEPLGVEIPSEPFPHLNTATEFRAWAGLPP